MPPLMCVHHKETSIYMGWKFFLIDAPLSEIPSLSLCLVSTIPSSSSEIENLNLLAPLSESLHHRPDKSTHSVAEDRERLRKPTCLYLAWVLPWGLSASLWEKTICDKRKDEESKVDGSIQRPVPIVPPSFLSTALCLAPRSCGHFPSGEAGTCI